MSTGALRILRPGAVVWDYSTQRPSADQLADANVAAASRYLSAINSLTLPKVLTYDEAHWLADLGVALMLNYEWTPDGPLRGAPRGVTDATWVNRFRHEHGEWGRPLDWPDNVPLVVSLDVGVTQAQIDGPCTDYWAAFRETYTGKVVGDYHGVPLHRRLVGMGLSSVHWTAGGAWAWSSPYAVTEWPTHIVQRVSGVGGRNQLLGDVAFWDPNGSAPEAPMMNGVVIVLRDSWVRLEGAWTQPTMDGRGGRIVGPVRWIDGPTMEDHLASGFDAIDRSWTELANMTYIGATLPFGDYGRPNLPTIGGRPASWDGTEFRDFVLGPEGLDIEPGPPVLVPHHHDEGMTGPAVAEV